ncbi:MAG: aminotransferase class V-fold PLP-dependent enzyme [Bdellovibrionales bacterium]|nr:aminotransferase class V-fold PLP-dependent enzyme [Bdellovibrionales bacterium]
MGSGESSRRKFLKQLGIGAASFAIAPILKLPHARADDDHVYFNTGTLGLSPREVTETVVMVMRNEENDRIKAQDEERYSIRARQSLAKLVGASAEEISLTHNATEGNNIVAWGLPLKRGDEVIVTTHEHVGGVLPWLNRARLEGIVVKSFDPAPTAAQTLERIESLMTASTRVIAIPHVLCTTGMVMPIAEIATLAHSRDAYCAIDGAQACGMVALDLHAMGVDFYATSGHKWLLGPKGTGFLYVRKDLLDTLAPKFVGAYSDSGWGLNPATIEGLNPTAHRYDFGTQNAALQAGLVAATDYFQKLGPTEIYKHGFDLATRLQGGLREHASHIELLTPTEDQSRGMITTFKFRDPALDFRKFGTYASENKFRVRLVSEAGQNAIRVSTHLCNTVSEIERFLGIVDQFA